MSDSGPRTPGSDSSETAKGAGGTRLQLMLVFPPEEMGKWGAETLDVPIAAGNARQLVQENGETHDSTLMASEVRRQPTEAELEEVQQMPRKGKDFTCEADATPIKELPPEVVEAWKIDHMENVRGAIEELGRRDAKSMAQVRLISVGKSE